MILMGVIRFSPPLMRSAKLVMDREDVLGAWVYKEQFTFLFYTFIYTYIVYMWHENDKNLKFKRLNGEF